MRFAFWTGAGEIGHNANRFPVVIGASIDLGSGGHDRGQ